MKRVNSLTIAGIFSALLLTFGCDGTLTDPFALEISSGLKLEHVPIEITQTVSAKTQGKSIVCEPRLFVWDKNASKNSLGQPVNEYVLLNLEEYSIKVKDSEIVNEESKMTFTRRTYTIDPQKLKKFWLNSIAPGTSVLKLAPMSIGGCLDVSKPVCAKDVTIDNAKESSVWIEGSLSLLYSEQKAPIDDPIDEDAPWNGQSYKFCADAFYYIMAPEGFLAIPEKEE